MGRYIDLDKCGQYRTNHGGYPDTFAFPPWAEFEDVAPVIHAHWIEDCGDYKCSHCSTEFWDEIVFIVRTSEHEFPNYCPCCGAKMDEE